MGIVLNILQKKPLRVIAIEPNAMVVDALRIMEQHNIGSVLVMENGRYMGLLTERDYARKVIVKGKRSTETKVGEIMSVNLPHVSPHDSVEHCMELMADNHVRYVPVFDNMNNLVGIISLVDLIEEVVQQQRATISHLREYITGAGSYNH